MPDIAIKILLIVLGIIGQILFVWMYYNVRTGKQVGLAHITLGTICLALGTFSFILGLTW